MNGEELMRTFAYNLARFTKAKFRFITKASERLGVSRQQYGQWLDGTRLPRPQTLCDLAELLDVKVADFFKEKNNESIDSQS